MSKDIRRTLRNTPPEVLKSYLASVAPEIAENLSGETLSPQALDELWDRIAQSPNEQAGRIFTDCELVEQMGDSAGLNSMRWVAWGNPEMLELLREQEDPRACAFLLLMKNIKAFRQAYSSLHAERLYHGKSWSGFNLEGLSVKADILNDTLEQALFEKRVADILKKSQAGLRRSKVEWFARLRKDRPVIQATVYSEDFARSETAFDDKNQLISISRRPVLEAAIIFDPESGALDICGKGGKKIHDPLCEAFCASLGPQVESASRLPRDLALGRLAKMTHFPLEARDGVQSVVLEALSFTVSDIDAMKIALEGKTGPQEGVFHQRLKDLLGGDPDERILEVLAARLRLFRHKDEENRKAAELVLELKAPNGANFRNLTEADQELARELLNRWGLYVQSE